MGEKLQTLGKQNHTQPPKMFQVNWFRRDDDGNFIWPGFGQNMRVLEWIINRCEGKADARTTAIGLVPRYTDLNWTHSEFTQNQFEQITSQDHHLLIKEIQSHGELFDKLGERMPIILKQRQQALLNTLQDQKNQANQHN